MPDSISDLIRATSASLPPAAILTQPVSALNGVSTAAEQALNGLGIQSVLDLAGSALFGQARAIVDGAAGRDPFGPSGRAPADLVDDAVRDLPLSELVSQDIAVLRTLSPGDATTVQSALAVTSIRDLALWPPYAAARRLLNVAYGGADVGEDPEMPSELVPRMGRLPVDRLQYDVLVFDRLVTGPLDGPDPIVAPAEPGVAPDVTDLIRSGPVVRPRNLDVAKPAAGTAIESSGPIDFSAALSARGYLTPGVGAMVTLTQSWYAVGLSLGQLLHSVALAPGESTRIAVIDWTRTVTGLTSENIVEAENLNNALDHNRSVREVTAAVAREAQQGFSSSKTSATSFGFSAAVAGVIDAFTGALGFGIQKSDVDSWSTASSSGERSLSGDLSQAAMDHTEQVASSIRSRRASIVSEVSVNESEHLSTRVLANYNHMHALSVLYFEVVQLYRVAVEVTGKMPVIFVPVAALDFSRPEIRERHRVQLAAVALSQEAQDALLGKPAPPPPAAAARGRLRLTLPDSLLSAADTRFIVEGGGATQAEQTAFLHSHLGADAEVSGKDLVLPLNEFVLKDMAVGWGMVRNSPAGLFKLRFEDPNGFKDDVTLTDRKARFDALYAYKETIPEGINRLGNVLRVFAEREGIYGNNINLRLRGQMQFLRVDAVSGKPTGESATVSFQISPRTVPGQNADELLFSIANEPLPAAAAPPPFDLIAHLTDNAMHYTLAVLRSLDSAAQGILLAGLTFGGKPLVEQVDSRPVANVGNYLVYRWPAGRKSKWWTAFVQAEALDQSARREALVPTPSGGVFAEAVLGRFNSAEKLDLSRFWNWQDSPIPILPPDIMALQAGQHQGETPLTPGALGAPVLNIVNAPGLPDPTGLAAALQNVVKGDAFRDMSGLKDTIQAGGAALGAVTTGAQHFMDKAMATVSAYGARVNQGKDMDTRAAATDKGTSGGGASGSSSGGGSGSSAGGSSGGTGGPGSTTSGSGGSGGTGGGGTASGASAPGGPMANERAGFYDDPAMAAPTTPTPQAATPTRNVRLIIQTSKSDPRQSDDFRISGKLALDLSGTQKSVDIEDGIGDITFAGAAQRTVVLRATLSSIRQGTASSVSVVGIPSWLGKPDDLIDTTKYKFSESCSMPARTLPASGEEFKVTMFGAYFTFLMIERQAQLNGMTDAPQPTWVQWSDLMPGGTPPSDAAVVKQRIRDGLTTALADCQTAFDTLRRNLASARAFFAVFTATIEFTQPTEAKITVVAEAISRLSDHEDA